MPFDLAGVDMSGALGVIELIGRILVGAVEALLIVPLGYVAILSLAAIVVALRPARRLTEPPTTRFVILIPAHNEAAVIAKLLASLRQLDYPANLFTPLVIADNCTDATAAIVRAAGVRVLERTSETERAKGYALRYALEQLAAAGEVYDAYVIVDADTVFAPAFLREMDAALREGRAGGAGAVSRAERRGGLGGGAARGRLRAHQPRAAAGALALRPLGGTQGQRHGLQPRGDRALRLGGVRADRGRRVSRHAHQGGHPRRLCSARRRGGGDAGEHATVGQPAGALGARAHRAGARAWPGHARRLPADGRSGAAGRGGGESDAAALAAGGGRRSSRWWARRCCGGS